ncbi:MAG TPA: M28 family peptidase [Alphaproteobacteria bacterium]|nr:M28 family peptidase [Alphaproteobacteria bacterium]
MRDSQSLLAARLHGHVERLAGEIGERHVFRPAALDEARDYIAGEWQAQGYALRHQWYEAHGHRCANLEVTRPGTRRSQAILLIGAHYDTVRGSPGADDNASGVASLLEMSRHFAGRQTEITLRFVAFVNEEPPFFFTRQQGSMVYARDCRARGEHIHLMVSLEMLGYYRRERGSQAYPPFLGFFYPDHGGFVGLVSDLRSRSTMLALAEKFRAHTNFPLEHIATFRWIPGVALSDHLSFWRTGYRAVMLTDTAFYRNPFYHRSSDRPDTLDYEAMAEVATGMIGAVTDFRC